MVKFNKGKVVGLAISKEKGIKKESVPNIHLIEGKGVENDAHLGTYREVSILSIEERDKISLKKLKAGEAAENILVEGINNISKVKPGYKIKIGETAVLKVLQVGKEFHPSSIHEYTGRPVLPEVGVFCRVITGGYISIGDIVEIIT